MAMLLPVALGAIGPKERTAWRIFWKTANGWPMLRLQGTNEMGSKFPEHPPTGPKPQVPPPPPPLPPTRRDDAGRIMKAVTDLIYEDPHDWSNRPCQTCKVITSLIGEPFGCTRYRVQSN